MESINPNYKSKKQALTISKDDIVKGLKNGDMLSLSKAISLSESQIQEDQDLLIDIIESIGQVQHRSITIGITGPPGVGKSSFIDAYGYHLVKKGYKVAVLAIDPTSSITNGSILGDKTRMEKLSFHNNAFIRPSPSSLHLGGVIPSTWTAIKLCEIANYDFIFIESVGVGQSEIALHKMVDIYTVLLLPGSGDELQGIKKGLIEMGDLFIVNKCDGAQKELAIQKKKMLAQVFHNAPNKIKSVFTYSSLLQENTINLEKGINKYIEEEKKSGEWENRRKQQLNFWFENEIMNQIQKLSKHHPIFAAQLEALKKKTLTNEILPLQAGKIFYLSLLEKLK